jgi:hypothetical protein
MAYKVLTQADVDAISAAFKLIDLDLDAAAKLLTTLKGEGTSISDARKILGAATTILGNAADWTDIEQVVK